MYYVVYKILNIVSTILRYLSIAILFVLCLSMRVFAEFFTQLGQVVMKLIMRNAARTQVVLTFTNHPSASHRNSPGHICRSRLDHNSGNSRDHSFDRDSPHVGRADLDVPLDALV